MTMFLNNAGLIVGALNGVGMIGILVYSFFMRDNECPTCRQRRQWKEGWHHD